MSEISSSMLNVIAVVGGLLAAGAAWYSARSAHRALKHAQDVERRSLLRDVTSAAQSVIAESLRVDDLSNSLKSEYNTLSGFTGRSGGSWLRVKIESVEREQQEVRPLQQEARECLEDPTALRAMTEEYLTVLLTQFEGYVIHIRRIKERLSGELASIEQQNKQFREHELAKARPDSTHL